VSLDPKVHPTLNAVSDVLVDEMRKSGFDGHLMLSIRKPNGDPKANRTAVLWMRAQCDAAQLANMVAYALSFLQSGEEIERVLRIIITHPMLAGRKPGAEPVPPSPQMQDAAEDGESTPTKKDWLN